MKQTKLESFKEAIYNIVVWYLIAVGWQLIIFPIVGIESNINQNLLVWLGFTLISLIRQYLIRRYFNNKIKWKN